MTQDEARRKILAAAYAVADQLGPDVARQLLDEAKTRLADDQYNRN